MAATKIHVTQATRLKLAGLKVHLRETYDDVVKKLIALAEARRRKSVAAPHRSTVYGR